MSANKHTNKLKLQNYAYEVSDSGVFGRVRDTSNVYFQPFLYVNNTYVPVPGHGEYTLIEASDVDWRPYKINSTSLVTSYDLVKTIETVENNVNSTTQSLERYLPLAGGTMTGQLKWTNGNALPEQTSPEYFLSVDAFANGGTTKWSSVLNTQKALGIKDNSGNDVYVKRAGDTMSGELTFSGTTNTVSIVGASSKKFQFVLSNSNTNVDVGWNWVNRDGAGMAFRSYNPSVSSTAAGNFIFFARDNANTAQLWGYPDGRLLWEIAGNQYKIWHAGNDGHTADGTGVDADLLDGQHGSYYAAASSLGNYLPLSGGTMTGVLGLKGNMYEDTAGTGALNLNNSDIFNVNSIKFADNCESASEGIQWYRDATHTDTLWDTAGTLYYTPNRPWQGSATNYKIWHEGNDGTDSGLDADTTDGLHVGPVANTTGNSIVRTNASGQIESGWIKTTSGTASGSLSRIYCSQDGYIRYLAPADFFSNLSITNGVLSVTVGGQNRTVTIDADTVDGYHQVVDMPWKYSHEATMNTTLTVFYGIIKFSGYSRPPKFLIAGAYNNQIDEAYIEPAGFSTGYIFRNNQQNNGNITDISMGGVYLNAKNTWFIKFRPIQDSTTSHYSPSSSATYKVYSNNDDFTFELTTTAPTTTWTSVSGTNIILKYANVYGSLFGNADTATTATNLAAAPSLSTVNNTQVQVTAGGKTSTPYTVPYATNADTVDSWHAASFFKWSNGTADTSAMTWGTLTAANGYNIIAHGSSTDGGDMGFTYKSGKIFMQLDGYFYQNEGAYRVVDTNDLSNYYNKTESDNRYVNVTGDTMTGGLTISANNFGNQLVLNRGSDGGTWGPSIIFQNNGTTNASLGCDTGGVVYIGDNGSNKYKIWHAGNDGSSSGLDADLLDGQHGSYYATSTHTHYVGTTAVQNSAAAQGIAGITSVTSPSGTAMYLNALSTMYIDSAASTSLIFTKGGAEMGRFNTSSNLCLGLSDPNSNTAYKLDVNGKGRFNNEVNIEDSTGYVKLFPGYIQIRKNSAANPTANYASIEFSYGSGQAMYIGYTPNDSYRASKGIKIWGSSDDNGNPWLEVEGNIYGRGFVKASSSDSYVLLGGGGHKLESSLSVRNADTVDGYHNRFIATGSTGQYSGWWKINITWESSWMLAFTVRVYQGYEYFDITFTGYNYGSNYWYQPEAVFNGGTAGTTSVPVKFGYDGTYKLWVAIPAGSYTGMLIKDICNGYTQLEDWSNKFTVTNVSSLTGTIQAEQTVYRPYYRNETVANATNAVNANKLVSLGSYSFANIATDIPGNAVTYKIISSGGTALGDSQYELIHIPWSEGDYGNYLIFGANNGRFGVKYKAAGAIREVLTTSNIGWVYDSTFTIDPNDNRIKCTKSTSSWDRHIYSKKSYKTNCSFSFKPANTTGIYMIGLNTDPTTDQGSSSIDYCWYLHSDGYARIYESGSNPVSYSGYAAGDEFRIEFADGYVRYYHNGVIKRTVTRTGSGAFFVDSSFHSSSEIYDVEFVSIPHAIGHLYGTDNTAANALLHSGPSRADNATGSTWIFADDLSLGNWGVVHNQPDNYIEYWGSGQVNAYISLNAAQSTGGIWSRYGFKKNGSSDNYVLLGGGGHELLSNLSSSHTHPYLPLAGGTMTGAAPINFTENKIAMNLRPGHAGYNSKIEYMSSGNEALVFANKASVTSFIFATGLDLTDRADYQNLGTVAMQIKSNKVAINKAVRNDSDAQTAALDVGGFIQASSGYRTTNYELAEYSSRLCLATYNQGAAVGMNMGSLLVSSAWADASNVPTNGIYSKGQIKSGVGQGTAPFIVNSTTRVDKLNADHLDGYDADWFMYKYRRNNVDISSTNAGMVPINILELKNGYPLYTDPEFASGNNGVNVYNNSGGNAVTLTRQDDDQGSGNSSGKILKIHSAASGASPWGGGWYFAAGGSTAASRIYVCIFRAKIPAGHNVEFHTNSIGSGGNSAWLTNTKGTGKWEWYAHMVEFGTSPSSTFFFTLESAFDADWYLSYANVIWVNASNYDGLRTRYSDDADTTDGLHVGPVANTTANRIVRTNASGHIESGWIYTTSGTASGTITRIYCSQDGYLRYLPPADFFSNITDSRYVKKAGDTMTGHLKMSGTTNLSAAWDPGIIAGSDGHDKVVLTYLASSTSGATIGAHNSALTAWATLNVSGTQLIFRNNETERMRLDTSGNLGIGTSSPSAKLHVNGDSIIGSKSKYYQRSTRGAIHHEFVGDDADYGVFKIRHTATEGSGGPGGFTATLGVYDERPSTISGVYEPTFLVSRTGATRVPDLIGVNIGSSRVFTVSSAGNTSIMNGYLSVDANVYGTSCLNRLTISAGLPFGAAYTSCGTRIYSNGIAFRDPYCGITSGSGSNDSMWIRMSETTANQGYAEIATGDDGNEPIYIRQYNTSSNIVNSATILDANGNTEFPGDVRVKGADLYVGSTTGSQCHQQYDNNKRCIKFMFD